MSRPAILLPAIGACSATTPKVCARTDSKAPYLLGRDTPIGGDDEVVAFRAAGHAPGNSIEPAEADSGTAAI